MNEELDLYLDHAHRDLKAAKSNIEIGFNHVAVSRSYYAMFFAVSALLASQNIYRSKHSGVRSAFGEYFVKTGIIEKDYARIFGNAYDSRLGSDYDAVYTVDKETAEDMLEDAQRFVRRIEMYLKDKNNEN